MSTPSSSLSHYCKGVHIIGLGAQTAVGRTTMTTCSAIRAGVRKLGRHPTYKTKKDESVVVAAASYLSADLPAVERMIALVVPALREALAPLAGHVEMEGYKVPLILALPAPRDGLTVDFSRLVEAGIYRDLGEGVAVDIVETIPFGHAAGIAAIERAVQLVQSGRSSVCLTAGVDSYLDQDGIRWLEDREMLRCSENPAGFSPGEGAAACLLANDDIPIPVSSMGRITATAVEDGRRRDRSGKQGDEMANVWRSVIRSLPRGRLVSQLLSDLNGQLFRSAEIDVALGQTKSSFEEPFAYQTPSRFWGDLGAASAPIFACNASFEGIMTEREMTSLISTSSFGGERGAALLVLDLES